MAPGALLSQRWVAARRRTRFALAAGAVRTTGLRNRRRRSSPAMSPAGRAAIARICAPRAGKAASSESRRSCGHATAVSSRPRTSEQPTVCHARRQPKRAVADADRRTSALLLVSFRGVVASIDVSSDFTSTTTIASASRASGQGHRPTHARQTPNTSPRRATSRRQDEQSATTSATSRAWSLVERSIAARRRATRRLAPSARRAPRRRRRAWLHRAARIQWPRSTSEIGCWRHAGSVPRADVESSRVVGVSARRIRPIRMSSTRSDLRESRLPEAHLPLIR